MTLMLIKYQFLKKDHMVQKIHSNTLLDTIMHKAYTNDWLCKKV